MLSAVIPSAHSYPAVPLARQQDHQGCVHPGPLVLGTGPLNSPSPTEDRDQTVSRRFKPSSRTTLNGEQPYPWDLLQPQDVMSRHRGAKPHRRCELLDAISLLSRRTFYPMSDGPSIRDHRITNANFRSCSRCLSYSQAPLCVCTQRLVSDQAEGTFACLRYTLGGDRPSQTTRQTLSFSGMTGRS